MKIFFYHKVNVLLILLLLSSNIHAQQRLTEQQKLFSLCMVWGFLKYNHPSVMNGKLDWDKELIKYEAKIELAHTKKELDQLYLGWINNLGKIKERKHKSKDVKQDIFGKNFDTSWMNNTFFYSKELSQLLHYIYQNRGLGKNYYAKYRFHLPHFSNEKPYSGMAYPSAPFRLLTLFRYWNVINYYYPSKYLIGENWNKVLKEMIPLFKNAKDTLSYQLAILELIAKINDSHAYFYTPYLYKYFGDKFAPFITNIIDNKAVVTKILNDSLANIDNIKIGDAILQIDRKPVSQLLKDNWKYIPASNYPTKLRKAKFFFFRSQLDSSKILFERNGRVQTKIIHRYNHHPKFLSKIHSLPSYMINYKWKIIEDSILYINVTKINKKEIKEWLKKLNSFKALILDMRCYYEEKGVGKISRAIHRKRVQFVKFLVPSEHNPGKFYFINNFVCKTGWKNRKFFKGKTVLLFNETTQSIGELSCMMLQSAYDVTSIGSQTAGADGSSIPIMLPGGYETRVSGMGVYYPSGKHTQRIGIQPNIVVRPTIHGIQQGKDEVFERAVNFIKGLL